MPVTTSGVRRELPTSLRHWPFPMSQATEAHPELRLEPLLPVSIPDVSPLVNAHD